MTTDHKTLEANARDAFAKRWRYFATGAKHCNAHQLIDSVVHASGFWCVTVHSPQQRKATDKKVKPMVFSGSSQTVEAAKQQCWDITRAVVLSRSLVG